MDTADCSAGQTGNVWFIDGTLGSPFPANGRNCTIPPNTALFLALKASNADNEACDPTGQFIQKTQYDQATLRSFAQEWLLGNYGYREIIIDGVKVNGLPVACNPAYPNSCQSPYRVKTPVFNVTQPAFDNLLYYPTVAFGDPSWACYNNPNKNGTPYTVIDSVGDGFYVMIKPLNTGKHTIQFGPLGSNGLPTRLYNIKVQPPGGKTGGEKMDFNQINPSFE